MKWHKATKVLPPPGQTVLVKDPDNEYDYQEFMKCMTLECGQKFENLESWEQKYGELKIYG